MTSIAGGYSHSIQLKSDGTVWTWGSNTNGELGYAGAGTVNLEPQQVPGLSGITAVAAGNSHNLVLKSDGTIWAWGSNSYGQLGNGGPNSTTPVQVSGLSGVAAISAGGDQSLALKSDGTVWYWGYDPTAYQNKRTAPTQVASLTGVNAIAAGTYHALVVKSDGTVWAWGANSNGQLGNGTTTNSTTPVQVTGLTGAVAVAGGYSHSLAVKSDGTVWAWGSNSYGQLGNGTTTSSTTPVQVSGLSGASAVAAGNVGYQSLALKTDGSLWAWGANFSGQLGNGSTNNSSSPVQVTGLTSVTAMGAGYEHSLAIRSDGTAWAWGGNGNYKLGDGQTVSRSVPTAVDPLQAPPAPCPASLGSTIAGGYSHSIQLKSDGTAWTWGSNTNGELGYVGTGSINLEPQQVPGLSGTTAVAAGNSHNLVLKSDGTVWAWGSNSNGQLGNGGPNSTTPVQVSGLSGVAAIAAGGNQSFALKSDGTVWYWGYDVLAYQNKRTTPTQIASLTAVKAIAAGNTHALVIRCDGTVWAWGADDSGQLGNGATGNFYGSLYWPQKPFGLAGITAVSGGWSHSLVAKSDGTAWAWGANSYGQLGNGTTTSSTTPVQVSGLSGASAVAAGSVGYQSLGLKTDGSLWAWGFGPLGNGTTGNSSSPVQVTGLTNVVAMGAGYNHSLAVRSDGTAWAWGWNQNYQLGDGQTVTRAVPTAVDPLQAPPAPCTVSSGSTIAGGYSHSIQVKSDGTVWTWGDNSLGQMGRPIVGSNDANPGPLRLAGLSGMTAAAAGNSHNLVLKSDGTVWAWGSNSNGQLGNGGPNSTTPVQVSGLSGVAAIAAGGNQSFALKSDGTVWYWGYDVLAYQNKRTTPTQIASLTAVKAIAAGNTHALVIRCDGTVWAWGADDSGQLGNGATGNFYGSLYWPQKPFGLAGITAVAGGWSHSLVAKSDGTAWAWGANSYGQLGNGTTTSSTTPVQVSGLSGASAVAAGNVGYHSLALKTDGSLWAWGGNFSGQLGNGTTNNSSSPAQVSGLTSVTAMGAGYGHSLAIRSDGTAWDWGSNSNYQLGDGTKLNSYVPEQAGIPRIGVGPNPGATLAELLGGGLYDMLGCTCNTKYPVNTATGGFWHTFTDVSIPGRGIAILFQRTYNSLSASQNGPLGYGWTDSYNSYLTFDGSGNPTVHEENGASTIFTKSGGTYIAPARVLATLVKNQDGSYTFTRSDKSQLGFTAGGQLQNLLDRNGYRTSLAYTNGLLTSVSDPAGRTLTLTYSGNLIGGVTDVAGNRSLVFQYNDGNGNLTDVQDVGGNWTHFTYDSNHLMLTMRNPNGGTVTNSYDASARVIKQWDQLNRLTAFDYSVAGQTKITDPKGNVALEEYQNNALVRRTRGYGTSSAASQSYSYDPNMLGITTIIDADFHTWQQTWDSSGNLLTSTDPLGRQVVNTYDSFNEILTTKDGNGVTTTNTYDAKGNLTTVSRPLVGTSQIQTMTYNYADPSHPGDITSMVDGDGKTWTYTYDANGYRNSLKDPLGELATNVFNSDGWMTSSVTPKGNVTGCGCAAQYTSTFTYNAFGQRTSATDPNGHTTAWHYDPNQNLDRYTDADNNLTTYVYDLANEQTQIKRADSPQTTLTTDYNPDGTVLDQKDGKGNAILTYGYDGLGRVTTITDALGNVTSYTYDGVGNRVTKQDPGGNCAAVPSTGCTTSSYDAANQILAIAYSDGITPNVSNITYDGDGQRKTMTDGTGTSTWTRDSLHRITSYTNGNAAQVQWAYNLRNLPTTITYPGNLNVTRGYDDAGRLTSVQDWYGHTTSFGYDANSNLTAETLPSASGVVDTFTFDAADQLTAISDARVGVTLFAANYGRDGSNQVSSDNSAPANQTAFKYTSLNQLCYAGSGSSGACAAPPSGSLAYSYDAADNLIQMAGRQQAFNNADELCWTASSGGTCSSPPSGATSFGYDTRGNRTSVTPAVGQAQTLGYDQANRLTSYATSSTTAYGYNGDGLRMSRTSGSTTQFVWDVASPLPLLLKDGATAYIYGPAGLPLEQISGSTTYYLHQDQLESTRLVTDTSGNTQASYTYDSYGNLVASTGSITNPVRFAGQYQDSESGLYYLRNRYYDPSTGQFITRDPLTTTTRAPYSYVLDNPLNGTDPNGLCSWTDPASCFVDVGIGIGQHLPGPARQAYVAGLSSAADWVGTTSDQLNSCDPRQFFQGMLSSMMLAGMLVPGGGEAVDASAWALKLGFSSLSDRVAILFSSRGMTVLEFAGKYLKGTVMRELPGEFKKVSVEEALQAGGKVRKLLTQDRFWK